MVPCSNVPQDAYHNNARCLPQQRKVLTATIFVHLCFTFSYKNSKPNLRFLDLKYKMLNTIFQKKITFNLSNQIINKKYCTFEIPNTIVYFFKIYLRFNHFGKF